MCSFIRGIQAQENDAAVNHTVPKNDHPEA
jgi:hypothetical protein